MKVIQRLKVKSSLNWQVKKNRALLLKPSKRAIPILLNTLQLCLDSSGEAVSQDQTSAASDPLLSEEVKVFRSGRISFLLANTLKNHGHLKFREEFFTLKIFCPLCLQVLKIMETLLVEAASIHSSNIDAYVAFASDGLTDGDVEALLDRWKLFWTP